MTRHVIKVATKSREQDLDATFHCNQISPETKCYEQELLVLGKLTGSNALDLPTFVQMQHCEVMKS